MWALVEGDLITRLIRSDLNVQVPGRGEPIGNLALLTLEERKKLGIYKMIEPEAVDHRYYAAAYTRYTINHVNAEVVQTNEIVTQPVARIVKYRIGEIREIRNKWENNPVMINVDRPLEGGWVTLGFKPTARLQSKLAMGMNHSWMVHDFIEDINGTIQRLLMFELRNLAEAVSLHLCQANKAAYEVEMILNAWPEEEADALIELDMEAMMRGRYEDEVLQHISDLKRWAKENFIDP